MRSERIAFVSGTRCRPELLLTVRALTAALVSEGAVAVMKPGEAGGESVSIQIDGEERVEEVGFLRLAPGHLAVHLGRGDREAATLPLLVPPLEPGSASSVLVRGGSADRRLRMAGRVLEVLRRRRPHLRRIAWLDFPEEIVRARTLDEIHPVVDADELGRLLAGAAVVFDAPPDSDLRTPLGELAIAAGIPLVTHEGAEIPPSDRIRVVAEWSDEMLGEAVDEAAGLGRGSPRDPSRALAELSGVLQS